MKNFIFVFTLLLCSVFLFSQVNFELDFSFEKIDPADELTNLQLFDYDNDGIEEIVAGFWNDNHHDMRVVVYSNDGSILESFSKLIANENSPGKSIIFKSNQLENYVLITEHDTDIRNIYLHIYNMASSVLIDSLVYEDFELIRVNEIQSILKTSINNTDYVLLGYEAGNFVPDDDFHSYIYKFCFENEVLNFVERIQNCGLEQIKYGEDHIFTSGRNFHSGGMAWGYVDMEFDFKKFTNEINSTVIDLYDYSGSLVFTSPYTYNNYPSNFTILSKNDLSSAVQVIQFIITDTDNEVSTYFVGFNSESGDIIWSSITSEIGCTNITASTIIDVNEQDNFVLYFRGYVLEIRDIQFGSIIHHQYCSICPIKILKDSNDELFFFEENLTNTGFNVYALAEPIYVSADAVLPISDFQLSNYPNPFNPSTTISSSVTQTSSFVTLDIYNIKGQKVNTFDVILSPESSLGKGQSSITWHGTDQNNNPVSSGIYFYQLKVDGKTIKTKKMLLLK